MRNSTYHVWAVAGLCSLAAVITARGLAAPLIDGAVAVPVNVRLPLLERFEEPAVLEEAGSEGDSESDRFWLNSGGEFRIDGGLGSTVFGALPAGDKWAMRHAATNPRDTDGGSHPQNIFRLFLRGRALDVRQQAYFRVDAYHLSDSPERGASNGLLLVSRAQDGDNLYYAGLRVDGTAVIKKKTGGEYHVLAQNPVLTDRAYDRDAAPTLLPFREWVGLRSEVRNGGDGRVLLSLYADIGLRGEWTLVAQAVDDGTQGGPALRDPGMIGIRTDFMDVAMDDYAVSALGGE